MTRQHLFTATILLHCLGAAVFAAGPARTEPAGLSISGIYPQLAAFSPEGEVGIGAVVPWADRLWWITYPPHLRHGSVDKLYSIDDQRRLMIHLESVGGTHACRLIHRESNQLLIGPYLIDTQGKVRAFDVKKALPGRLTAIARHLTDPANKVYYVDMEGPVWEANVHTLETKKLFEKPLPGWHGKGAYSGQGRLVVANNGEVTNINDLDKSLIKIDLKAKTPEEMGVLGEWSGNDWRIIERHQFTDVTGPGGIHGNAKESDPLWSIGWDHRSVILKLLDDGRWHTFRLPKAALTYDHRGGWYTEWPRIREVGEGRMLMDMHGMFYEFPKTFSAASTGGIKPIASHLRYVPDFCNWNGRLVLAGDDTSIMQNPMAGQSQSNLWFGKWEDLATFGPKSGWGGPWIADNVQSGEPSTPFLVAGFDERVAHLANHGDQPVKISLESDSQGNGKWQPQETISLEPKTYAYHLLPANLSAEWLRASIDKNAKVSLVFHFSGRGHRPDDGSKLFASMASIDDNSAGRAALIRPAKHNRNLQVLMADGKYWEVDEHLAFSQPDSRADEVAKVCAVLPEFSVDAASVMMTHKGVIYRLPKGNARYDAPVDGQAMRCKRECLSERFLVNAHGTIYLMGRESGLPALQPVCSHGRQIYDFCTWRGLLVMSGTKRDASPDGNYFGSSDAGLWFGHIDDLWKFGKPVGRGGPWKDSAVKQNEPSDPYLMAGYDQKSITLSHDRPRDVIFAIEVDIDHTGWHKYKKITVPAGKATTHKFEPGYSAHWLRVTSDVDCRASAQCVYE